MFQVDVDYLKKAKKRREVAPTVITIVLAFAGVISALPIVYLFVTAFKPAEELFLYPPRFYVANPTLKNFSDLVSITANTMVPFTRYLFNTIIITALYMFHKRAAHHLRCGGDPELHHRDRTSPR